MADHAETTNARILLSIEDIMRLTPLKKDKIHELMNTGMLPFVPLGRFRYVRRAALEQVLAQMEVAGEVVIESGDTHQRSGRKDT